jgi:hypothetical protein
MLGFIFITLGSLFLVPLLFLAKGQRKQTLAEALPRAVEIAMTHGWVSAGRLMAQSNLTEKDARDTLLEASRRGLLLQAENGRYYVQQKRASLNSEVSNQQD